MVEERPYCLSSYNDKRIDPTPCDGGDISRSHLCRAVYCLCLSCLVRPPLPSLCLFTHSDGPIWEQRRCRRRQA